MNSLVSVIIPTFNRAKTLKRAIDSVFSQTYTDWEIVVIDNSSSDETVLLLQNYNNEKVNYITVENNGVIGYSRNQGIKKAKGNFIAFLDSDDWWDSFKLEKCVESLIENNADVVYHNCHLVSRKSKSFTRCRSLNNDTLNDLIVNGNTLVTSSVVLKKSSLKNIRFSEESNCIGWEDYNLWINLARASNKFIFLKEIYGVCWQGEDNFDNPERVLVNLVRIEEYFTKEFSSNLCLSDIWWIKYTKGIALLKVGKKLEAKKSFTKVVLERSPLIYKLKSVYYKYYSIQFNKE